MFQGDARYWVRRIVGNGRGRTVVERPRVLRLLWVVAAVVSVAVGGAEAESAREMLDRAKAVNDAREPKDVEQRFTMRLVDSQGRERVRELAAWMKRGPEGEDRAILFFLAPPEVKGVGFLSWAHRNRDDDQWLYLPELKRVRQITTNTRRQSFQGSDFSYEDLELFDDIRDWTERDAASRLVKDPDVVDGVPCAVIELVPQGKDLEYGRFVVWLDKEASVFRRVEFYDRRDDRLLKTLLLSDFRTVEGIPTPYRLEMRNERKGTRTVMEFSEVRYNQGLDDELFTQRTLERGRVR
jgi:outer membrane lipoprotein-sorting protein